ncbi:MAG: helix-turn-helix domain-containing protein [Spirochaetales bacterium]|nr:helix-turn-helix domain-containing protein [Exilispira sp.]NMC67516.1 helix-turn-helix domain-containing protein [Spirochaetales bacterium]
MNLSVVEVADLLQIPKSKILKLAETSKIPAYKINGQYLFSLSELIEWSLINHNYIFPQMVEHALNEFNMNFIVLFERGNLVYDIVNSISPKEYDNLMKNIAIPQSTRLEDIERTLKVKNSLTIACLKTSYAALHPRNPLFCLHKEESISIVNFQKSFEIDDTRRSKVNTVFINFNANAARHLLCRLIISYLCQSIDMAILLEKKEEKNKFIDLAKQIINK